MFAALLFFFSVFATACLSSSKHWGTLRETLKFKVQRRLEEISNKSAFFKLNAFHFPTTISGNISMTNLFLFMLQQQSMLLRSEKAVVLI